MYLNKADEVSNDEDGKEHTYLQNLSTLDNINHTRRIQFEKIKRKFGLDLWEKPQDELAYKYLQKREYHMLIETYKKNCREYDEKKKK